MSKLKRKEYGMKLNELRDFCHQQAVVGGWWNDIVTGEKLERNKGELISLMHSELSECMEGVRKNLMDDKLPHRKMEEVELADTIIRILDYCGGFDLDIEGALFEKLEFNKIRDDHQIESRLGKNGKKF